MKKRGFSLIEILVAITIIGLIAGLGMAAFGGARDKARDSKRKNDLAQIGRFLSFGCYAPDGGEGSYDLADIAAEVKLKNPQYAKMFPSLMDPKSGSEAASNYIYIYSADNKCAIYGNLENKDEKTSLGLTAPTPGGGTGVLAGPPGVNGTNIYFQVSN